MYNQPYNTYQYQQGGYGYGQQANVIPMNIHTTNVRKDPFLVLNGHFEYNKLQGNNQVESANITLKYGQQIKIDIPTNGSQGPRVFHQNQEVQYHQYFQWQQNLLELVKAVSNSFQPVIDDPLLADLVQLANQLNEDGEFAKIKQMPIGKLLNSVLATEYQAWLQKDVKEEVKSTQEYVQLFQYLMSLSQWNVIVAEKAVQNDDILKQQAVVAIEKNNYYTQLKSQLLMISGSHQSFTERFERTKILGMLEKLKESQEEQADNFLEEALSKDDYCEDEVQKYYQLRKKYHRANVIGQKFSQIM